MDAKKSASFEIAKLFTRQYDEGKSAAIPKLADLFTSIKSFLYCFNST